MGHISDATGRIPSLFGDTTKRWKHQQVSASHAQHQKKIYLLGELVILTTLKKQPFDYSTNEVRISQFQLSDCSIIVVRNIGSITKTYLQIDKLRSTVNYDCKQWLRSVDTIQTLQTHLQTLKWIQQGMWMNRYKRMYANYWLLGIHKCLFLLVLVSFVFIDS